MSNGGGSGSLSSVASESESLAASSSIVVQSDAAFAFAISTKSTLASADAAEPVDAPLAERSSVDQLLLYSLYGNTPSLVDDAAGEMSTLSPQENGDDSAMGELAIAIAWQSWDSL